MGYYTTLAYLLALVFCGGVLGAIFTYRAVQDKQIDEFQKWAKESLEILQANVSVLRYDERLNHEWLKGRYLENYEAFRSALERIEGKLPALPNQNQKERGCG